MRVPLEALSPTALRGLVEELVTREGTDYGEEVPLDEKARQVLAQLHAGEAVVLFDPETESCTIVSADEARARGV